MALAAATSASAQVAFDSPINFPGGDGMRFVVSIDLDGDGTLDLTTANKSSGTASVLLNNGDGTFATPVDYAAGIFPFGIAAADLDRDGDADLAIANGASNDVSILLNNGDGTFAAAVDTPVGTEPHGVAAADLDRDGDADLAVVNLVDATVSILTNDGSGGFAVGDTLAVGPDPISIAAADLDGDGAIDLAVVDSGRQLELLGGGVIRAFAAISVLLNHGDGSFAPEDRYQIDWSNPLQIIAADLDGDGAPDLATANHIVSSASPGSWVTVLPNLGDGTFGPEAKVPSRPGFDASVLAADLDLDGSLDLVTAGSWTPGEIEVMMSDGAGGFAAPLGFAPGGLNAPSFVTAGDYDRDGDVDVVAASRFSDNFALYLNQLVPNPVRVQGTPDLEGAITKIRTKAAKGVFQLEAEIELRNIGDGPTGGLFVAHVFLSTDPVLEPTQDTFLRTLWVLSDLPAGRVDKQKIKLDRSSSPSGLYLLVEVDVADRIAESDETNNEASIAIP